LNSGRRGGNVKHLPLAFTEQGVAMLSSVLNSPRAIQVNIAIMRVFVRLRETLSLHKELPRNSPSSNAKSKATTSTSAHSSKPSASSPLRCPNPNLPPEKKAKWASTSAKNSLLIVSRRTTIQNARDCFFVRFIIRLNVR
jgi:hypothetical protein